MRAELWRFKVSSKESATEELDPRDSWGILSDFDPSRLPSRSLRSGPYSANMELLVVPLHHLDENSRGGTCGFWAPREPERRGKKTRVC
jgi:hypothetical protein